MPLNNPVLPERSHVFDAGVVQKIYPIPGLEVGIDGYYKIARDLLDDGQFGAAYVLSMASTTSAARTSASSSRPSMINGNFRAYANVAWAKQIATNVVSNQYPVRSGRDWPTSPRTISTPTTPRS